MRRNRSTRGWRYRRCREFRDKGYRDKGQGRQLPYIPLHGCTEEHRLSHYINFIRIPALAIGSQLRPLPKLGLLDTDCVRMRVWPSAIDWNLHLNNAQYLSAMDYGRVHLLARTQILAALVRARWTALVGATWVTYRRSLPVFARYALDTRLVCWDERWFYMEQVFTGKNGLAAVGWVKGALREPGGIVNPQKVLEGIEPGIVSPPIPDAIATWNEITREKLNTGTRE